MSWLIRGGVLHTEAGDGFPADILIEETAIAAVAPHISLPKEKRACTLSAQGLHVLPGVIAPCLGEHEVYRLPDGVAAALLWPDEGPCHLMTTQGISATCFQRVRADALCLDELRQTGKTAVCAVESAEDWHSLLQAAKATGCPILPAVLQGADTFAEELAAYPGPLILDAAIAPVRLVQRLLSEQRTVALCGSLEVCAALCRNGCISPDVMLRALTATPAALLGCSDTGCILPGCRADLVLFDGDPLREKARHVITIRGGKVCC